MAKVARRAKTRKKRTIARMQRRAQQERVQAEIDQGIAQLVRETIEAALQHEVTKLLGRAKWQRRDPTDPTEVAASCNRCATRVRSRLYRAGFYKRSLLSFESWGLIQVPRVSCVCGGMVDVEFEHLVPYGRQWFDLQERARELAGLCVSLRDSVQVLAWRNRQPLAIATLNNLVNQTAELASAFQAGPLARVPAVVMLDGIWLKVLFPTGEEYTDAQGRRRQRVKRRKFPLLVAYGVNPASGERWLLDWQRGREEDEASWRVLLERLLARGLCAEAGLHLFIHDGSAGLEQAFELVDFGRGVAWQRCIFHKLANVGRDVQGAEGMDRAQRRQRRQEVLQDAAAVYQGTDEGAVRRRLAEFRAKWGEREPKAVATLERDFDRTLVYLRVQARARQRGEEWRVECLRATSTLERVQRHFRQKARQVVIFHTEKGVDSAVMLVIYHRQLLTPSTLTWASQLEEALLAA